MVRWMDGTKGSRHMGGLENRWNAMCWWVSGRVGEYMKEENMKQQGQEIGLAGRTMCGG